MGRVGAPLVGGCAAARPRLQGGGRAACAARSAVAHRGWVVWHQGDAAHLAAKGVGGETASGTLEEAGTDEVTAALAHLRRRRAGPFDRSPPEEAEAVRGARRMDL